MLKTIEIALRANVSHFTTNLGVASAQTRQFTRDLTDFSKAGNADLRKVGTGAMVMGAGMLAGFGLAANAAMGFDKSMSEVAAVSGATAGQLGDLRQAALDAGAATVFSASQAAQAQAELAKAGVSTGDILGGALRGSLDLASAGSLDLARSAEIAANAMTIFKLRGSDVPHVADVLAAAANKSAASVDDMAMALQQGGLVASQLGIGLEDTTGTLAMFAQAGLRGSDAGTSLKTMLMSLTPKSKEAAELMEDLGLRFFDANGEFVGLEEAAAQLRTGLGNLSQEQRFAAMQTIFGTDAIRAANILYEAGADGVARWSGEVNDAGYAAELARIKTDNLAGDLEQLRGSLETALIKGGSQGTSALRGMTQAATALVNGVASMPAGMQAAAMGILGVGGAAMTAAGAASVMIPRYRELVASLQAMGPGGMKAATAVSTLTKYLGMGVAGVAALSVAWSVWNSKIEETRQKGTAMKDSILKGVRAEGVTTEDLHNQVAKINEQLGFLKKSVQDVSWYEFWNQNDKIATGDFGAALEEAGKQVAAIEQRSYDWAKAAGVSNNEMLNWLKTLDDFGASYKNVDDAMIAFRTHQLEAAGMDHDQAVETAKLGQEYAKAAKDIEDAKKALEDWSNSVRAVFDPMFGVVDAMSGLKDAQDALTEAQKRSFEAAQRQDWPAYAEAQKAVEKAQMDLLRSNVDLDVASHQLVATVEQYPGRLSEAKRAIDEWTAAGRISAGAAADLKSKLEAAAFGAMVLDAQSPLVEVHADISQFEAAMARVTGTIQAVSGVALSIAQGFVGPPAPQVAQFGTLGTWGAPGLADGGIVHYSAATPVLAYANGGEYHGAHIAGAGAVRMFNEPETGGEAYIPMAPAKRQRSTIVLSDVAQRFGYSLAPTGGGPGGAQVTQVTHHHYNTVNVPNYLGSKQELVEELQQGLRSLERSMKGAD